VLGVWLALAVAGLTLGGQVFDRFDSIGELSPEAESMRAERRVDALLPEGPIVVAVVGGRELYEQPLVDSVVKVATEIRAMEGVKEVEDLYSGGGGQIGADNRSSLVRVELDEGLPEQRRIRVEEEVSAALHRIDAPEVLVGGEKIAERAFADQAIRDAAVGETVAIVVLLIVLVVLLGGFVAGAIPLAAALAAVSVTLLGLLGLTALTEVSEFTANVVTLLGIGLAVDYALLMVARFREERDADPDAALAELVARTTATAGRTVLVAGLAVAAPMLTMFVFAGPLLAAMALGGAIVGLLATAAGLTLVPALIAAGHAHIPAPGDHTRITAVRAAVAARLRRRARNTSSPGTTAGGVLARLAAYAQSRPGPVVVAVAAGLLVLSLPFVFAANLENSDARALPASAEARRLHETVLRDFDAGRAAPLVVIVEADPTTAAVRDLMNQLNTLPGVVLTQPRSDVTGTAAVIDVTPSGETAGSTSRDLVRRIRALEPPFPVLVGGPAAELVDYQVSLVRWLPLAVLMLLLSSAALLFVLTGSLVTPVKALSMNALTLLATLGVLVVVFQWGWGAPLLGFQSWGAIDLTTPVLLFVLVFGLSMDYEVFLLARIKEEWDRLGPRRAADPAASDRAVLAGITKSGPVVTSTALCISVVFLGFLLGDLVALKEIGFGMAVALLLDVTVVRGLLLPALMSLLGEWNWWAPAPLRRLHRRWFQPAVRVSVSKTPT
jgi:RND superfamily putative drug exporter